MITLEEISKRLEDYQKLDKEKRDAKEAAKLSGTQSEDDEEDDDPVDESMIHYEESNETGFFYNKNEKPVVLKNRPAPKLNIVDPNPAVHGAEFKFRRRFSKYLAFINTLKYSRASSGCTILPLSCTSELLLNIWGSSMNISHALKELKVIGLIEDECTDYQWGAYYEADNKSKTYRYYVDNERKIVAYCQEHGIEPFRMKNLTDLKDTEDALIADLKGKSQGQFDESEVRFYSKLTLQKPEGMSCDAFKERLEACLRKNYPEYAYYQALADRLNADFYDRVDGMQDFHIRFKPHFKWGKNHTVVKKIGIRATNKLCGAHKNESGEGSRSEILTNFGLNLERDITSSVPRVSYALNYDGWLKDEVDLYSKIYMEYSGEDSCPPEMRKIVKGLFFRVYFDNSDKELGHHTWRKMVQDGASEKDVYDEMAKLRAAMSRVIGPKRFNNEVFFAESCIYLDVLDMLLRSGFQVWQVYDCFYAKGKMSQEAFSKLVTDAVAICFMRFNFGRKFGGWDKMF